MGVTTKDQELEAIGAKFEEQEAGVADLLELYKQIEDAYVEASSAMSQREYTHASDSANLNNPYAYLG